MTNKAFLVDANGQVLKATGKTLDSSTGADSLATLTAAQGAAITAPLTTAARTLAQLQAQPSAADQAAAARYVGPDGADYVATAEQFVAASPLAISRKTPSYYDPTITHGTVYNGALTANTYRYNHDASLEFFNGMWYCLWNANTTDAESSAGQYNLMSTSADFVTWSAPVKAFIDPSVCSNPVTDTGTNVQFQPCLLVYGGQLLCYWCDNAASKLYVSKMSAGGKWVNTDLSALYPVTVDGISFANCFPTQDPILLPSGRIACPVVMSSSSTDGAATGQGSLGANYRMCAVLVSDDGGATHRLTGLVTRSAQQWAVWEPVLVVQPDGMLRMYCRSQKSDEARSKFAQTATSADEGETWSTLEAVGVNTSISRYGFANGGSRLNTKWGFKEDFEGTPAFTYDRRNLALWAGSGANDMMPLVPITPYYDIPGMPQTYAQGRVRNGNLYVVSTLIENSYASTSILSAVVPLPPAGPIVAPRGAARCANAVPQFKTGPVRFRFGGYLQKLGGVVSSSAWGTGAATFTWCVDSRKLLTCALFDNRGTNSGFVIQISQAQSPSDRKLLFRYYNGSTLTDLDTGLTVPYLGGKYWGAVSIDGAGQSLTATIILPDGTVQTNTVGIPIVLSNLNGSSPFMGTSKTGSGLFAFLGDVYRMRVYDIALTAANVKYLYEQDRALIGLPAVTGTQTAPAAVKQTLDATDSHSGTNDATWLASWPATDQYAGAITRSTLSGVDTLKVAGNSSLSFAPCSSSWERGHYSLRYQVPSGRANEVGIITIGQADNYIEIGKASASSGTLLIRRQGWLDNSVTPCIFTAGSVALRDAQWYGMSVKFAPGVVTITHDKCLPVDIPFDGRPALYLGRAHNSLELTTVPATDYVQFDVGSFGYGEHTAREANVRRSAASGTWTPVLQFGGAAVGMTYAQQAGFWERIGDLVFWSFDVGLSAKGSSTGSATITGWPFQSLGATGAVNAQGGSAIFETGMSASATGMVTLTLGGSSAQFRTVSAGASVSLDDTYFTSATRIRMSGWYMTPDPVRG